MTLQISPSQLEIYRRTAREREADLRRQVAERREHAWNLAHQAAQILKEEFGASRVVVFGSLIHPDKFHFHSDIDLGVWDIKDYFRAVARLMDLDPQIEFDLVPVEDARPGILAVIEQEGKAL